MSIVDALRGARAYDLEQPRFAGAPVWPAHEPGVILNLHRRHERDAPESRTSASAMLVMTEHSGTHIDALCHQAYGGRMHGDVEVTGRVQTSVGFTALGIDTVAPIVARGVLLDVAGAERLPEGYRVTAVRPRARRPRGSSCAAATWCSSGSARAPCGPTAPAYLRAGGMTADASRWLAARSPLAVGADNVAFDIPDEHDPDLGSLPGHTILIVQ